jgi:hypothetical protein
MPLTWARMPSNGEITPFIDHPLLNRPVASYNEADERLTHQRVRSRRPDRRWAARCTTDVRHEAF